MKAIKWTIFNEINGVFEKKINLMAIDSKGDLWCCRNNISKFNGSVSLMYKRYANPNAITVTKSDEVWFGTNAYGALIYNGIEWEEYDSNNFGLTDNSHYLSVLLKSHPLTFNSYCFPNIILIK